MPCSPALSLFRYTKRLGVYNCYLGGPFLRSMDASYCILRTDGMIHPCRRAYQVMHVPEPFVVFIYGRWGGMTFSGNRHLSSRMDIC